MALKRLAYFFELRQRYLAATITRNAARIGVAYKWLLIDRQT
jgi:hypothetical protein